MRFFLPINKWFAKRSIKTKLKLMIVGITIIGVFFSGICLAIFQWQDTRKNLQHEFITMTKIIADNSISAVMFSDSKDAKKILATLVNQPSVIEAIIYDDSGHILAQYIRENTSATTTSYKNISTIKKYSFTSDDLKVIEPIYLGKIQIGTVFINTDLSILKQSIKHLIYALIVTLSLVIFLSYFIAEKLQNIISAPIFMLTRLARKVSNEKDYSHRAEKNTDDELGILTNDFNEMLNQVEKHDKALRQSEQALSEAYDKMEEKVATRTTELKTSNNKLLVAKDQAENANQVKSDFLANMSHEIRTPMNAVLGFTELLQQTHLNKEQKSYMHSIQSGAKGLMTIINDILDLTKLEADKIHLEYEAINLYEFIESIEEIFSQIVFEKGLYFDFYIDDSVPKVLTFDQTRVRQILVNLIGNAIKFTDEGMIEVHIKASECESPDRNQINISFAVSDSGIGINIEQQQKIFEKFTQQDGQSTKRYGGTGLGLSICLKLAKLMKGKIELKSQIGAGSTFTLSLHAIEVVKSPQQTSANFDNATGLNFNDAIVLLVDESQISRTSILEQFSQNKITFIEAKNGLQAIPLAQNYQPNLIILGVETPVMDGLEAAIKLKEHTTTRDIPIIALTTVIPSEKNDIKSKTLFDNTQQKPVTKSKLIDLFKQYLLKDKNTIIQSEIDKNTKEHNNKNTKEEKMANTENATPSTTNFCQLKVLVVDDDDINRDLIIEQFEHCNIDFTQAENGKKAVELCLNNKPDVVLMDMTMPIMDGNTANNILKSDIRTEFIPVVAISGHVLEETELYYQTLVKPVNRSKIEQIFLTLSTKKVDRNKLANQQETAQKQALLEQLIEIEKNNFQRAIKSGLVDDIHDFSNRLNTLSQKFNDQEISKYSEKLSSSASLFDIGSLETLLAQFPQIIAEKQTTLNDREEYRE